MARMKPGIVITLVAIIAALGWLRLRMKGPDSWVPAFVAGSPEAAIDPASIARENPFRISTGPNSARLVDSSEVTGREFFVKGRYEDVVDLAKKELPGWKEEMVGDGRTGVQLATTMDHQFVNGDRALKVYRKGAKTTTRVRVWHHRPSLFRF